MERNMPLGESQERVSGDRSIPEVRDLRPPAIPPSKYLDRVLLIGTALLVGMTGVGSFWLADHFQVNPVWVFAAWSSILIVPLFIKDLTPCGWLAVIGASQVTSSRTKPKCGYK
jgi:hypothetical protein